MKCSNNKGFTLIELIATLVILSLVMVLGAYSITGLIKNSKEKDYELLVKEIKTAIELYYQECKYVKYATSSPSPISCPTLDSGSYTITLGDLVEYGYLKGNSEIVDENNKYKIILINPNDNGLILDCEIRYKYVDGKFIYDYDDSTNKSCPVIR